MNLNLVLNTQSAVRLAVALTLSGGILLIYARFLFGPFPRIDRSRGRDSRHRGSP